MSDEFDKKREQIRKKHSHLDEATVADLLEDKSSYGETFFVPKRARWRESSVDDDGNLRPALKDLKHNIGQELNKAIAALEEENIGTLEGVLKNNIDFNETKGKSKVSDEKWKDLLDHFNDPRFILVNENFGYPRMLYPRKAADQPRVGDLECYQVRVFAVSSGGCLPSRTALVNSGARKAKQSRRLTSVRLSCSVSAMSRIPSASPWTILPNHS